MVNIIYKVLLKNIYNECVYLIRGKKLYTFYVTCRKHTIAVLLHGLIRIMIFCDGQAMRTDYFQKI